MRTMEASRNESPVQLKTPRLLLREFEEEDLLEVHEYLSDPEVFRYMIGGSADQQQSKESIRKIIEARSEKPRLDYSLVVTLNEKGRVIGGSRVRVFDPTLSPCTGFWAQPMLVSGSIDGSRGGGMAPKSQRRFFLSALTNFVCIESSRGAMLKTSRLRRFWIRSECGERAFL